MFNLRSEQLTIADVLADPIQDGLTRLRIHSEDRHLRVAEVLE